jgi:hypothetical protein
MRWGIAGIVAMMLAGCDGAGDPSRQAEHSIDPATGETVMTIPDKRGAATLRAGPSVPVALPQGFSLFPGTRVTNNARFTRADGEGTLVTFTADAPAKDILAHYRREAEAAGFAITLEHEAAGSLLLIAERERDGARLAVTVTEGAPTSGQLVFSAFGSE